MDVYKSISSPSDGLYKELGSRFIAFAFPVETEEEAKARLEELRRTYHDARHCCFAWRLGLGGEKYRSNDDGEPSGTAGRPILGQIDSAGLSDILIVVVRYFGGIKLGVPGLTRAYRAAAQDALASATVIEKTAAGEWRLDFSYDAMNAVMKLVKDLDLPQKDRSFSTQCSLIVRVRLSLEEEFKRTALSINSCEISRLG